MAIFRQKVYCLSRIVLGDVVIARRDMNTDATALYTAAVVGPPAVSAKRRVLSLTAGAATVHDTRNLVTNIDTSNGKERIETTFQIDYEFGVGLRGHAWDTANGGASPSDAALGTGSNWDKVATSIKHAAGVMSVGQAKPRRGASPSLGRSK